ncbi:MAG: hypothetical protein MZU97_20870, partial [Bacillus subtilis]|nr:hypothetical protein [Bacillus subtilis]
RRTGLPSAKVSTSASLPCWGTPRHSYRRTTTPRTAYRSPFAASVSAEAPVVVVTDANILFFSDAAVRLSTSDVPTALAAGHYDIAEGADITGSNQILAAVVDPDSTWNDESSILSRAEVTVVGLFEIMKEATTSSATTSRCGS